MILGAVDGAIKMSKSGGHSVEWDQSQERATALRRPKSVSHDTVRKVVNKFPVVLNIPFVPCDRRQIAVRLRSICAAPVVKSRSVVVPTFWGSRRAVIESIRRREPRRWGPLYRRYTPTKQSEPHRH